MSIMSDYFKINYFENHKKCLFSKYCKTIPNLLNGHGELLGIISV